MSNEELIVEYQGGNRDVLEKIIERNKTMVIKLANKFYTSKSNGIDQDDLIQEGYLGIMLACKKYDINNPRKASFNTYAVYWVYKKMHQLIQKMQTNDEVSIQSKISDSTVEVGDTIQDQTDYIGDVEKSLYYTEVRSELNKIMDDELTLFEKHIIKLNYGWDGAHIKIGELASIYKYDKKKIVRARTAALNKIRNTSWGRKERLSRLDEMH